MSHTSRRGPPPVECPLASLGRNTPSLDTQQFHHPLSSSPLNPEVYQMSRNSPLLTVQSNKIGYSTNHHPTNNVTDGQQMYQLSRSSSSSIDQTYALRNRDLEPKVYRQLPHRNYTPIDSLLSYHERMSPQIVDRSGNVGINCGGNNNKNVGAGGNYLLENRDDDDDDDDDNGRTEISNMVSINHHNNEYLLEQKMDALYLQGAIRNLPLGGNPVRRQKNPNNNHHSNSNTERYYLEENMEDICHYPSSNRLGSNSPNLLRRASSPSETSGSDRYLIERYRQSPAIIKTNRIAHIKSQDNNLYPNANNNNEQTRYALPKAQLIIDGLSRFGRFSPSLDQGYHTLVSPSPSVPQTPGPWNKKGPCRSGPGFDRLPDDAVLKIFEWLDSCELCNIARVCRRFETLAWNPFLWKNITLRGEHIGGDKALKTIFRRLCGQTRNGACPAVEKVMLSDGCKISDKGMQLLARRCPELTHLQIQFSANVTNLTLFDVVTRCTNLQHLDITGCSQITCININTNLESPRRLLLQYLDLTDCAAISDAGLKVIVRNCPQLVYLYLRRCVQITDAGLKFVPSFCIALRELSVSDCSNITDFGLYELAKLGATLRYLSVAKCDQVSDAGLKVIARRCYKLRYLNARGCEAVSDDSITVLARSCPRLRALDIGKCDVSDAGLRALAESCPNLKKLSLRNCDMITDRGVQCIAYYCRGLQQLNIQDCQISLEGYRAVKKYCKRCIIEHTNPGFC